MDQAKIKALIDFMGASDLSSLSYQEGDVALTLGRSKGDHRVNQVISDAPVSSTEVNHEQHPAPAKQDLLASQTRVIAPHPGVIYLSPSESEPAFVQEGDRVEVGDTLCLLEAMKMYHSITATHAGVIQRISIANGQEVEADQVLFEIGM